MANKLPGPPSDVGYCKPPKANRFQKGRSGNPKGRPRGSKNKPILTFGDERLKGLLLTEAYRTILIQDAGKPITMSMAQAVIRSVAVAAAKGQARAQRLFLEMIRTVEEEHYQSRLAYIQTAMEYKVGWEDAIEDAKRRGLPVPDPLPHPKDICINPRTGDVRIEGPVTEEERDKWNLLRARKREFLEAVEECKADLANPKCKYKKQIQEELEHNQRIVELISRAIKD